MTSTAGSRSYARDHPHPDARCHPAEGRDDPPMDPEMKNVLDNQTLAIQSLAEAHTCAPRMNGAPQQQLP
jgi:hypothetical protein